MTVTGGDRLDVLAAARIEVQGQLAGASNATLLARAVVEDAEHLCVIKPVAGERPLWDFPDGTLSGREVAAFSLSEALGWDLVPTTVWRDDLPGGAGMCQWWIDEVDSARPVDVVPPERVPAGWATIIRGEDGRGRSMVLAHRRSADLERLALFDVLANNADRKGGHILADRESRLWAIDHGVCFSADPKLRTVLWGWAGELVDPAHLADVERLDGMLRAGLDSVDRWLDRRERAALRQRVSELLATGRHPLPAQDWPAVPWPLF